MSESEKYKQFAADCLRIAETLTGEDRKRLLKIADAWTERALEAETTGLSRASNGEEGQAMVTPGPNNRCQQNPHLRLLRPCEDGTF